MKTKLKSYSLDDLKIILKELTGLEANEKELETIENTNSKKAYLITQISNYVINNGIKETVVDNIIDKVLRQTSTEDNVRSVSLLQEKQLQKLNSKDSIKNLEDDIVVIIATPNNPEYIYVSQGKMNNMYPFSLINGNIEWRIPVVFDVPMTVPREYYKFLSSLKYCHYEELFEENEQKIGISVHFKQTIKNSLSIQMYELDDWLNGQRQVYEANRRVFNLI